tara:strand:- start:225 stop:413 length:189 start_codon:yes stop_codon:yes gene_type:complete
MNKNLDWSMSISINARTIDNGVDKDYYSFAGEVLDQQTLQAVKEAVLKAMLEEDEKKKKRGW